MSIICLTKVSYKVDQNDETIVHAEILGRNVSITTELLIYMQMDFKLWTLFVNY